MFKKIIFLLYLIGSISLFIEIVNYTISNTTFYIISVVLMLLGLFLYPLNKRLNEISDFLIIPFIVIFLFNIVNVSFINNFNKNISLINILFGAFGFSQYFLKRLKK